MTSGISLRLRAFYFLYYAGLGAFLPYYALYLRGLGFSGDAIGAANLMNALAGLPAGFLWALVAIRMGAATRALKLAALTSAVTYVALPIATTPAQVTLVLGLLGASSPAVILLLDSVTVGWAQGRKADSYSAYRLFGCVGYVLMSLGLGFVLTTRGSRVADVLIPLAILACAVGYCSIAQTLPRLGQVVGAPAASELSALVRNPRVMLLFLAFAVHSAGCTPYYMLYGVLVSDLRLPEEITGLGMSLGVATEVVAFWLYPTLQRKFSLAQLLSFAFGLTAIRWFAMAYVTSPAALIALQTVQGATFALYWGGAMQFIGELIPRPLQLAAQTLLSALVYGVANTISMGLAGLGYEKLGGAAPLFAVVGFLEVIPLIMILSLRHSLRTPAATGAPAATPPPKIPVIGTAV